jgi:eukaryotic-like serine/threonine-protein kinase
MVVGGMPYAEIPESNVGAYTIKLWDLPADQVFNVSSNTTISPGVPALGAGSNDIPGRLDTYRFTATPGQRINVTHNSTGANPTHPWTWLSLQDSTGTEVAFAGMDLGKMGLVTLTKGGTYSLVVGERNKALVGDYTVTIAPAP